MTHESSDASTTLMDFYLFWVERVRAAWHPSQSLLPVYWFGPQAVGYIRSRAKQRPLDLNQLRAGLFADNDGLVGFQNWREELGVLPLQTMQVLERPDRQGPHRITSVPADVVHYERRGQAVILQRARPGAPHAGIWIEAEVLLATDCLRNGNPRRRISLCMVPADAWILLHPGQAARLIDHPPMKATSPQQLVDMLQNDAAAAAMTGLEQMQHLVLGATKRRLMSYFEVLPE